MSENIEQFFNTLLADSNGKSSNGFTKKKNIRQDFHPGDDNHCCCYHHWCHSMVPLTDLPQSRGSVGWGWDSIVYNRSFFKRFLFFFFYMGAFSCWRLCDGLR